MILLMPRAGRHRTLDVCSRIHPAIRADDVLWFYEKSNKELDGSLVLQL